MVLNPRVVLVTFVLVAFVLVSFVLVTFVLVAFVFVRLLGVIVWGCDLILDRLAGYNGHCEQSNK
jgi:hypothetical protein